MSFFEKAKAELAAEKQAKADAQAQHQAKIAEARLLFRAEYLEAREAHINAVMQSLTADAHAFGCSAERRQKPPGSDGHLFDSLTVTRAGVTQELTFGMDVDSGKPIVGLEVVAKAGRRSVPLKNEPAKVAFNAACVEFYAQAFAKSVLQAR